MRLWWRLRLWGHAVWPARNVVGGSGFGRGMRLLRVLLRDPASVPRKDLAEYMAARLAVGVRGAAFLLREGGQAHESRRSLGDGLVEFDLPGPTGPFWVDVTVATALGGWGPPPRAWAARVRFADAHQALEAQEGSLDILAEVATGRMQVEGRLPAVERLNEVMREVARILEAP